MDFSRKPDKEEFTTVEAGTYEVYIEMAEERPTNSGRKQLSVKLKIRDDVQQKFKNRVLFLNIFQKKPENMKELDKQVGGYIYAHLYQLLDATGLLGQSSDFDSISDICKALRGRELRVVVHHEVYNGMLRARIDQLKGVLESDADVIYDEETTTEPPAIPTPQANTANSASGDFDNGEELSDEELPF